MAFPIAAAAMFGMNVASNIYQNTTQREIADETNAMNMRLSREQMQFQERMSNTAHQREKADLIAAGMNPILTATGGPGASSPGGASATMIAPEFTSPLKGAGEAALGAMQTVAALKNSQADTENKMQSAALMGQQQVSTAKDIERKGIENAHSAQILGQEIKKNDNEIARGASAARIAGVDANMSERTAVARMRQIENESLMSKHKNISAEQAAKYDYEQEKMLDRLGMNSSSAKPLGPNASLWDRLKEQALGHDAMFRRRIFRGGGK